MSALRDPTLTIEEFARLCARAGMKKINFKKLLWTRAERAFLEEALAMAGGRKLVAAKMVGLSGPNFHGDLRRSRQKSVILGI